jgi:hypothetical protein
MARLMHNIRIRKGIRVKRGQVILFSKDAKVIKKITCPFFIKELPESDNADVSF